MANEQAVAGHSRTIGRPAASQTLPRKRTLSDTSICRMYFLAGAGLIKIGITTNLTSRIRSIRNSSPVPLELLATMTGCTFFEECCHYEFHHLRRHGEWFEDEGSIREYILSFVGRGDRKLEIQPGSTLALANQNANPCPQTAPLAPWRDVREGGK